MTQLGEIKNLSPNPTKIIFSTWLLVTQHQKNNIHFQKFGFSSCTAISPAGQWQTLWMEMILKAVLMALKYGMDKEFMTITERRWPKLITVWLANQDKRIKFVAIDSGKASFKLPHHNSRFYAGNQNFKTLRDGKIRQSDVSRRRRSTVWQLMVDDSNRGLMLCCWLGQQSCPST